MNAQKTITMDYEEYREELRNEQSYGYARGIKVNAEENILYQKTLKKATKLETQLGICKHTLRGEWDKNYRLDKDLKMVKDQVAIYKFLTFSLLVFLLFSEAIKAWLL